MKRPLPSKMITDTLYLYESPNIDISIPKIGKCKIRLRSKEGPIPHFHIQEIDGDLHSAVCLHEAKYFIHGIWKDKLNNHQLKYLQKWLL